MQIIRLILYLLLISVCNSYAQQSNEVSELDIQQALEVSSEISNIQDRLLNISAYFLNRPYFLGPAGEGETAEFDQKPISTWERFDCVTYVEAVLALAKINPKSTSNSVNLDQYYENIKLIKYHHDEISFLTRNHFTELDWIPHLQSIGFIQDLTKQIFPFAPAQKKVIDKHHWFMQKTLQDLYLPNASQDEKVQALYDFKQQVASLELVPHETQLHFLPFRFLLLPQLKKRLPKVSIFSLVRGEHPTNPNIPVMVSHQGLLIKKDDNQFYIRHASTSTMTVTDILLDDYINLRLKDAWPSLGLNLQFVL